MPEYTLYRFDTLESTNTTAKDLIFQNAHNSPLVVIAKTQTQGRGTGGRTWFSQSIHNFYGSIAFANIPLALEELGNFTLQCAKHLCETLSAITRCPITVKHPNDLMLNGKKLAGILAESYPRGEKRHLVIGFGLNINSETQDFPQALRESATSLKLYSGQTYDFYSLEGAIIESLIKTYHQAAG